MLDCSSLETRSSLRAEISDVDQKIRWIGVPIAASPAVLATNFPLEIPGAVVDL